MAANLAISSADFQEKVLNSDVPVLVDFWAPWCGPCRAIGPVIEELSTDYADRAKVFKLDVDVDGDIAAQFNVTSIPAVKVFKGGKVVAERVGVASKKDFAAMIDSAI
jgi:thioredoxin 1